MDCTTVKPGVECVFMTKNGCSFNGGTCHPIVEQCQGCDRTSECASGWYCTACPDPSLRWKNGKCNLATHVKASAREEGGKINPLKASKRNAH
ncbi:MAG: PxxKW family cysteine-rich protein [Thermodesulfobacteriota bacterium]|nr:PxxKW family cysteine-rich protein [Thermodesulfobacteriota bacterium]